MSRGPASGTPAPGRRVGGRRGGPAAEVGVEVRREVLQRRRPRDGGGGDDNESESEGDREMGMACENLSVGLYRDGSLVSDRGCARY